MSLCNAMNSGCVLCSPGCFSMFRGSALIDDNIMAMYTTPATEAKHYVQYDQGRKLSFLQNVKTPGPLGFMSISIDRPPARDTFIAL